MAVSGLAGRQHCAFPPFNRRQLGKAGQRPFSVASQPALRRSTPSAGKKLDYEAPRGRPKRATSSKILVAAAVVGSLCYLCYQYCYYDDGQAARGLNGESFARFVVVAREPISPTAVVLTLQPAPQMSPSAREVTRTAIADAWGRRGTWSVEVKQPQLQIAREYTPLPPGSGGDGHDSDGTTIRLFVRIVPGGEMSRYLVQRQVGDTVSLRGPRAGFAVKQRLGPDGGSVVFLAAGTGIAPALQAADAALRADDGGSSSSSSAPAASVTILWANRLLQDSEGYDRDRADGNTAADASGPGPGPGPANPIVRDLQAIGRRYGRDRVQVHCFADEDRSFITEAAVRESLSLDRPGSGGRDGVWGAWTSSIWPWKQQQRDQNSSATTRTLVPAADCPYHSAAVLERLAADPEALSMTTTSGRGRGGCGGCSCSLSEGGKQNLLMISGPDGFVSFWAGPKSWAGGQERQGPVGGVMGALKSRYVGILDSWTVLKL